MNILIYCYEFGYSKERGSFLSEDARNAALVSILKREDFCRNANSDSMEDLMNAFNFHAESESCVTVWNEEVDARILGDAREALKAMVSAIESALDGTCDDEGASARVAMNYGRQVIRAIDRIDTAK